MDSYTNSRRAEYGRSQMFRNASSGMTVGAQSCCAQPNMPNCPTANPQTGPQPIMRTAPQTNMQTAPQMNMQNRSQVNMSMPTQPSMAAPSAQAGAYVPSGNVNCPGSSIGPLENFPIGMGYVPMQQWRQTYSLEQGFSRGTIFPELDLPFIMGRCQ